MRKPAVYLDRSSNIDTEFTTCESFEDSGDDLGDILFETKLFDVVQQLGRNVSGEACLALFDEGRVLFDVGVEILEGRRV